MRNYIQKYEHFSFSTLHSLFFMPAGEPAAAALAWVFAAAPVPALAETAMVQLVLTAVQAVQGAVEVFVSVVSILLRLLKFVT